MGSQQKLKWKENVPGRCSCLSWSGAVPIPFASIQLGAEFGGASYRVAEKGNSKVLADFSPPGIQVLGVLGGIFHVVSSP